MANRFTKDANCVAAWRFESGVDFTLDTCRRIRLTDNNTVSQNTSTYKEGACCASFDADSIEYFSITDLALPPGFPMRDNDAVVTKNISVCCWVYVPTAFSATGMTIASKYDAINNDRCWHLSIRAYSTGYAFTAQLGYNGGSSGETLQHTYLLSTATWYHVTLTYENTNKTWAIRVRDASGNAVGTDATGTATLDASKIYTGEMPFLIGAMWYNGIPDDQQMFDGEIDELAVFSDVLTSDESTLIALGRFPWVLEQEGFRFRNDDGSESGASWKAAQDTNVSLSAGDVARLRALVNVTDGDPGAAGYGLEYRYKPSGGAFGNWKPVLNPQS